MSKLLRAAKRKGADAVKFQYDIDIHVLEGTNATEKVLVQWVRGAKIAETRPVDVENKFARFEQRMSMLCTMYLDPKKGVYGPKPTKFTVKEARAKKGHKTIGQASVDLADYANGQNPKTEILVLKGASGTVLRVTIHCQEVRAAVGRQFGSMASMMTDDDMTDISGIDDLSQMGDDFSEMDDVSPSERKELNDALQRANWDKETLSKELAAANRELTELREAQAQERAEQDLSRDSQEGGIQPGNAAAVAAAAVAGSSNSGGGSSQENSELQAQVARLKKQLAEERERAGALEVEKDTAVETVKSLTSELKTLAATAGRAEEYEAKYNDEKEARVAAEDRVNDLEMTLEEGNVGTGGASKARIEELEHELAAARATNEELANANDAFEIDLKAARRDLGAAEVKYNRLKAEQDKLLADLDPEETKQLRHSLEVANEEKKIILEKQSELEHQVREREQELSQLQREHETLKAELSTAKSAAAAAAAAAAAGDGDGGRDRLGSDVGAGDSPEVAEIRQFLMTAHEEIADLKDSERQAQNEIDQLRSENRQNLALITSTSEKLKAAENKVQELEAQAANRSEADEAHNGEVDNEMEALRAEMQRVKQELQSAQEEREEMESALNSAIEENETLEAKVKQMGQSARNAADAHLSADAEAMIRSELAEAQAQNVKYKAVHDAAVSRLESFTKSTRAQIQELQDDNERLQQELKIAHAGGKASEPSDNTPNLEIDELLTQLVDAKMRLAEAESRCGQLQHQVNRSGAGRAALLQQNEDLSAALVQSKLNLAQAQNEIANLDTENKRNKRHYEKIKETNAFLGRRQTSIEVKLVKAEQANAELQAKTSAQEEEIKVLKSKMQEIRANGGNDDDEKDDDEEVAV